MKNEIVNTTEEQRKTIWELEAEAKTKAQKVLKEAKKEEQIKLDSGNYEFVQIDKNTKVLRKIKQL